MSPGFSTRGTPYLVIASVKPLMRSGDSFDSPGQPMTIFAPSTNCSLSSPIWLRRRVNSTQCEVSKSRRPSLIMGGLLATEGGNNGHPQDTRCRGGRHNEPDGEHEP